MEDQIKDLQDGFKKAVDEGLAPIKADLDGLKKEMEVIKETPVYKNEKVRSVEKIYKGYNLNKMGSALKEKCVDNQGFDVFKSEEKIDQYSKWMIDFLSKASYAEGAAGTGGALVPDEYQWDIVKLARNDFFMLREARVVNMNSDTLYLPTEATLPTVEWDDEAGTIGASEGTFGQVTLTAKRINSLVTLSNELLADSAMDVVSILTEQLSYGTNYEIDKQSLAGTGSPT